MQNKFNISSLDMISSSQSQIYELSSCDAIPYEQTLYEEKDDDFKPILDSSDPEVQSVNLRKRPLSFEGFEDEHQSLTKRQCNEDLWQYLRDQEVKD